MRIAYVCADAGVPVFGSKGCSIHVQEMLRALRQHGAHCELFAIDTDGVVSVSAKDLGTGKSQSIEVTASSGLTEAEVERLVEEAEGSAAADKALRSLIDLRNKADGLMYSSSRALEEFVEDVDPSDAQALKAQIEKTAGLVSGADPEALESAIEELSRLSYALTEQLYAALGGADESVAPGADESVAPEADPEED